MNETLECPSWYRVQHLCPKLRAHVRIRRQVYRGQIWYVLEDRAAGRFHRFSPTSYLVIGLMDGRRSMQQIWESACALLEDDALTQDDLVRLLAQLHQNDVLQGDVKPDLDATASRAEKLSRRKRLMSVLNPMAVRVPLLDPDDFLDATLPAMRPFLSWFGLLVILAVTGHAISLAAVHWDALTHNIADRVLAAENVAILLLTYPVIKAAHELGHAYLVKKWGGEVHEMGIMFLVFMPVPYVDASAASAFREKWRRALVGAAGVIVEVFLAALAMIVWAGAEDTLVRAVAFNVMFIGGVSTVLFNGNPLLRFDGYYVLADLIEIPNLGPRANRYIGYLLQRRAFGSRRAVSPVTAPGEAPWLFFYAIASFLYRMVIMVGIITFVASQFFVVGVVLAIWGVVMMVVFPLARHAWFLLTSPALRDRRGRALSVTAGAVAALVALLAAVPVPYATVAEGVVWTPGDAVIHARGEGEVTDLMRPSTSEVSAGEPLAQLSDAILEANLAVVEAKVAGLRARLARASAESAAESKVLRRQLDYALEDLARYRERKAALTLRAPRDGELVLAAGNRLVGDFLRKGELVGYVVNRDDPAIRVIVPESRADLVRSRTRAVHVRFAERMERVYEGRVARSLPLVSDELPSPALATVGGGLQTLDPRDPQRIRALDRVIQLEIRVEEPVKVRGMGGRVYVRFYHGEEPVARRIYRAVRQYFLSDFNV